MKVLRREHRLCISCMEEHDIDIIETEEQITYKGMKLKFSAIYEYCSNTDEYTETEDMIKSNGLSVKDAYRRAVGLLTSNEIIKIREKYNISQKELSEILNWGKATITRYENHQVQDKAHDDILRKIDSDPKWFLELLERSKDEISSKMYSQYYSNALQLYSKINNPYSYSKFTTRINFDEYGSIAQNTDHEECAYSPYKTDFSGYFPYKIKPLFIEENCIFAN